MIQSGGFVTLDTVTANDNLMFGADIVADGFIDIQDSVFSNNLNGSGLSANPRPPGCYHSDQRDSAGQWSRWRRPGNPLRQSQRKWGGICRQ